MGSRSLTGLAVASAFFASCGGDTPSAPPTAPRLEITLMDAAPPANGSTILVAECVASGGVARPICSIRPALSFAALSDAGLPDATLSVEFYTDTELRCAISMASRVSLAPGVRTPITSGLTFLSSLSGEPPFCALPVTTTRIVAHLHDGNATRVTTAEFPGTYTFARAGAARP